MRIAEGIHIVGSGQLGLSSELDCHVYLIDAEDEAVLVDSGAGKLEMDAEVIIGNVEADGIDAEKVKRVFLTHAHADHAGGTKFLKDRLKCEVCAHGLTKHLVEKGSELELGLDIAKQSGFYGMDYRFKTFEVDRILNDGDVVSLGEGTIRAIHTPGHSIDSTCYVFAANGMRALFTGDVLSHGGKILLLNCPGFDLKDYRENIRKLQNLSVDMLLPGHGMFALKNAQRHVDILIDAFGKLLINNQIIL